MTNLLRVLGGEPFCYRPWEIARLTPVQVREIMAPRDDKGVVILEPPLGIDEGEVLTLAGELRTDWLKRGIIDPDALALVVDEAVRIDREEFARMEADGAFEDDEDYRPCSPRPTIRASSATPAGPTAARTPRSCT